MNVTDPKYVKPETLHIGDVIRVTDQVSDTEQSIVGRVATREYQSSWRVLKTALGVELLRYNPNIVSKRKTRVTLLEPAASRDTTTPLFDMDVTP